MVPSNDLRTVEGLLLWTAADYPDDRSWVYDFDDSMLVEIEAAAKALQGNETAPDQIDGRDFSLLKTDVLLRDTYNDLESGPGFAMLAGLPVADWEPALSKAALCIIGTRFGRINVQNRERDYLLDVVNKSVTVSKTFRGYHGNDHLDFHNDGANTAALLCLETAAEGGESLMVSAGTIYNEVLRTRPDLLKPLLKGFQHHRRNQREPNDPVVTPYRAPVFSFINDVFHSCYSRISIESTREENIAFTALETEALDYLDAQMMRPELQAKTRLREGDIQLMNNFTILHSRTAFVDKPGNPRHLLRLWLDDPKSRYNGPNKMDFYVPEESKFLQTVGYESFTQT